MTANNKVGISVYLNFKLLSDVEKNVQGKNRSEKLCKCISKGYAVLNSRSEGHGQGHP